MRRLIGGLVVAGVGLSLGLAAPAAEAGSCPPDAVASGTICIDKFEASVWGIPPTKGALIKKIRLGTVTLADLTAPGSGAVQHTDMSTAAAIAVCPSTGNGCKDAYAVSIAGVTPSGSITWFQAVATARNAGKRLPSNAEWQAAALGTPDGAPCIVLAVGPGLTGTVGCVSDVGVFDMVGNLNEWVADWVPLSTACVPALFASDLNCLAGADITDGPGALRRGGNFTNGAGAGVFAVNGTRIPSVAGIGIGFRAAR